jgi:hypothetical protein
MSQLLLIGIGNRFLSAITEHPVRFVAPLLRIWDVPETDCPDRGFSYFSSVSRGVASTFPNSFQFSIHNHPTIRPCVLWATGCVSLTSVAHLWGCSCCSRTFLRHNCLGKCNVGPSVCCDYSPTRPVHGTIRHSGAVLCSHSICRSVVMAPVVRAVGHRENSVLPHK